MGGDNGAPLIRQGGLRGFLQIRILEIVFTLHIACAPPTSPHAPHLPNVTASSRMPLRLAFFLANTLHDIVFHLQK